MAQRLSQAAHDQLPSAEAIISVWGTNLMARRTAMAPAADASGDKMTAQVTQIAPSTIQAVPSLLMETVVRVPALRRATGVRTDNVCANTAAPRLTMLACRWQWSTRTTIRFEMQCASSGRQEWLLRVLSRWTGQLQLRAQCAHLFTSVRQQRNACQMWHWSICWATLRPVISHRHTRNSTCRHVQRG